MRMPQFRTTISAAGPSSVVPNADRSAACGAKAAWSIVQVSSPETIITQRIVVFSPFIGRPPVNALRAGLSGASLAGASLAGARLRARRALGDRHRFARPHDQLAGVLEDARRH